METQEKTSYNDGTKFESQQYLKQPNLVMFCIDCSNSVIISGKKKQDLNARARDKHLLQYPLKFPEADTLSNFWKILMGDKLIGSSDWYWLKFPDE